MGHRCRQKKGSLSLVGNTESTKNTFQRPMGGADKITSNRAPSTGDGCAPPLSSQPAQAVATCGECTGTAVTLLEQGNISGPYELNRVSPEGTQKIETHTPQKLHRTAKFTLRLVHANGWSELRKVYLPENNLPPPEMVAKNECIIKPMSAYRRASRTVFDLIIANDWSYWFTMTIAPKEGRNRGSLPELYTHFRKLIKRARNAGMDIKYLVIPEPHKDGSWHLHGVILGLSESDFYRNKNGHRSWAMADSIGFHSFVPFNEEKRTGCAVYMTKYMTKDWSAIAEAYLEGNMGGNDRLFWSSIGLKKPEIVDLDPRLVKKEIMEEQDYREKTENKNLADMDKDEKEEWIHGWKRCGDYFAVRRLPDGLHDPLGYVSILGVLGKDVVKLPDIDEAIDYIESEFL